MPGVILANVTPAVLAGLLGEPVPDVAAGCQVKVNLMLRRLPRLRDSTVTPEQAFGGTFHINETLSQLDGAYTTAAAGEVPAPLPCEIYCHSLTDPSILSAELRDAGAATLTVFGLHVPHGLQAADPERMRSRLTDAVLASLNSVLAEPIQDVVMTDAHGRACIETKTTVDLENALGLTAGNIFHGDAGVAVRRRRRPVGHPGAAMGGGHRTTNGSCCADQDRAAAERCPESAVTMPRWRYSRTAEPQWRYSRTAEPQWRYSRTAEPQWRYSR